MTPQSFPFEFFTWRVAGSTCHIVHQGGSNPPGPHQEVPTEPGPELLADHLVTNTQQELTRIGGGGNTLGDKQPAMIT